MGYCKPLHLIYFVNIDGECALMIEIFNILQYSAESPLLQGWDGQRFLLYLKLYDLNAYIIYVIICV